MASQLSKNMRQNVLLRRYSMAGDLMFAQYVPNLHVNVIVGRDN